MLNDLLIRQIKLNVAHAQSLLKNCNKPHLRSEIDAQLNTMVKILDEDQPLITPVELLLSIKIVEELIKAQDHADFQYDFEE